MRSHTTKGLAFSIVTGTREQARDERGIKIVVSAAAKLAEQGNKRPREELKVSMEGDQREKGRWLRAAPIYVRNHA